MSKGRIGVVVASFNRKSSTIACLDSVRESLEHSDLDGSIVLVDDNSSDGTREAVAGLHPDVRVVRGDSTWYWAGSVRRGMELLEPELDSLDGFILANDDVTLAVTAIGDVHDAGEAVDGLAGGAVYAADGTLEATGGLFGRVCRPLQRRLEPSGSIQRCDMLPGHCLYIPTAVYRRLGPFSPDFVHGFLDLEYSLRAARAGVPRVLVGRSVGSVAHPHHYQLETLALDLPLRELLWRLRFNPKAPAVSEGVRYLRLAAPVAWPLWIVPYYRSYLRLVARSVARQAW